MFGLDNSSRLIEFDCMYIISTCKYEKDPIRERVAISIFRSSRAANSVVHGQIWPNFELIQAFMHVLIACKYEKDQMKNSIISLWDF